MSIPPENARLYVTSPLNRQPVLEHLIELHCPSAILTSEFEPRFGDWQGTVCLICWELYQLHESIVALPCHHFFHKACFYHSLAVQLSFRCGVCRASLVSEWAALAARTENRLHRDIAHEHAANIMIRTAHDACGYHAYPDPKPCSSEQLLCRSASRQLLKWRNRLLSTYSLLGAGASTSDDHDEEINTTVLGDVIISGRKRIALTNVTNTEVATSLLLADKTLELLVYLAVETDDDRSVDWLIARAGVLWNHIAEFVSSIDDLDGGGLISAATLQDRAVTLAIFATLLHRDDFPKPALLTQETCAQDVFEALHGYGVGSKLSDGQRLSQYAHICAIMVRAMRRSQRDIA